MHKRFNQLFRPYLYIAAAFLFATASAKVISATGYAKILNTNDPILLIPYRYLMLTTALIEFLAAAYLVWGKSDTKKLLSLCWLGVNFIIYRIAIVWLDPTKPCPCLGTITQRLPISQPAIDAILGLFIVYITFGSSFFLLIRRVNKTTLSNVQATS